MRRFVYFLFRDFFIIGGLYLLFLLMIEDIQPGFVGFWLEIRYLLFIVLAAGALTLFTSKNEP